MVQVKNKIADVIHDSTIHPLEKLAQLTVGYSGSDLKDVVHHGMPEIFGTDKMTEATLLSGLAKVGSLPSVLALGQCVVMCVSRMLM